ncbi:branched-chain amino acid transport system ATP-binding protein [Paraburkholderia sp. 40]
MNDHDHSTVERDGAIRQQVPSVLGGAVMDAENMAVIGSCLPLLRIRDVSVRFGGVVALDKVSFDVEAGQICGLIGPNGAGKSTLFNCLSRLYDCNEGSVEVGGISTLSKPKHEIAHMGIGRTFQNLALFKTMSVRENVLLGVHGRVQPRFLASAWRFRSERVVEADHQRRAQDVIDSLGLAAVAERTVSELPFGTQKRVEMARALISRPRLLLLDEPACGLNHEEVEALGGLLQDVRQRFKLAVLLVEHHMGLVMSISDKVVALNFGRKIAEGTPEAVRNDGRVIEAYLGKSAEHSYVA